jgi:hypothetical protein
VGCAPLDQGFTIGWLVRRMVCAAVAAGIAKTFHVPSDAHWGSCGVERYSRGWDACCDSAIDDRLNLEAHSSVGRERTLEYRIADGYP